MTNDDYSKLQSRLEALPPATLAKALLNLTFCSDEATQVVETLTTSPEEAVASFKRKLSGIKRRRRFYHRTDARLFASELEALLQLLDKPAIPPTDALAALVLFFEADGKLFEMADDSYGDMGSVFRHTATTLFRSIAKRIEDQALLIKTVKKLYTKNEYGARDCIADHAAEFLTSESLESLHTHYSSPITIKDSDSQAHILTKALAAQLKNPEQYEAELRQHSEHYYKAHICELASVYQAADRHQDLAKRLDELLTFVRDCDFLKLQNIGEWQRNLRAVKSRVGNRTLANDGIGFFNHSAQRVAQASNACEKAVQHSANRFASLCQRRRSETEGSVVGQKIKKTLGILLINSGKQIIQQSASCAAAGHCWLA